MRPTILNYTFFFFLIVEKLYIKAQIQEKGSPHTQTSHSECKLKNMHKIKQMFKCFPESGPELVVFAE